MRAIVLPGGPGGTSFLAERGCRKASEIGMAILREGKSALEAAVTAAQWMEDSRLFNAGSGAILRIDGVTIHMDAAVADSSGHLAMISAVPGVKNPVVFAYRLATETTLVSVGGDDARRFAVEQFGLDVHPGPTLRVQRRYTRMM